MLCCRRSVVRRRSNLAVALAEHGILDELGVELIGAPTDDPACGGPRALPGRRPELRTAGPRVPDRDLARQARQAAAATLVVRPAFTLGGHGAGSPTTPPRLRDRVERGLAEGRSARCSSRSRCAAGTSSSSRRSGPQRQRRDRLLDREPRPDGRAHRRLGDGGSAMTLSDEGYQELRAAAAVIRAVGVETGGSNIQFAGRETEELRVIEMNPRVSRSSRRTASKATGYPIAKVAAKLAVGYTLDEIPNDLTKTTPASFEPTLDYVIVKFPALCVREVPRRRPAARHADEVRGRGDGHRPHLQRGVSEGVRLARAPRSGSPTPWPHPLELRRACIRGSRSSSPRRPRHSSPATSGAKRAGWGDDSIGAAWGVSGEEVRRRRREEGVVPSFRRRLVRRRGGGGLDTTARPGANRTKSRP